MSGQTEETELGARQLTIRLRCESKANQIMKNVEQDLPLREFFEKVSELTGIPGQYMVLLAGYPPKKLQFDTEGTVKDLGLSLQDTLNVQKGEDKNWVSDKSDVIPPVKEPFSSSNGDSDIEEVAVINNPQPGNSSGSGRKRRKNSENDKSENPGRPSDLVEDTIKDSTPVLLPPPVAQDEEVVFWEDHESTPYASRGFMLRHSVPNDNSCLFWAVLHGLGNRGSRVGAPAQLRRIIADAVARNPDHYNLVFLGRSNEDYQKWICNEQSWGGAIELAILSEHFGIEFAVVNIQAKSICVFGEDMDYASRVYLIYDGIHYDALHLESFYGHAPVTEFRREDESVYQMALEIGVEAFNSNQYTDINNFTLRCTQCNEVIVGDDGARKHTMATRHVQFEEMKPPF